jgi:succinate dehydrogenase / fumarate reductase cytochrome b subunit
MLSSILHRASGVVLYLGLLKLCLLLGFMAAGRESFDAFSSLIYSPFGAVFFFFFSGILIFHFLNGLRHLVWDAGKGFDAKQANTVSLLIVLAAFIGAGGLSYLLIGSMT